MNSLKWYAWYTILLSYDYYNDQPIIAPFKAYVGQELAPTGYGLEYFDHSEIAASIMVAKDGFNHFDRIVYVDIMSNPETTVLEMPDFTLYSYNDEDALMQCLYYDEDFYIFTYEAADYSFSSYFFADYVLTSYYDEENDFVDILTDEEGSVVIAPAAVALTDTMIDEEFVANYSFRGLAVMMANETKVKADYLPVYMYDDQTEYCYYLEAGAEYDFSYFARFGEIDGAYHYEVVEIDIVVDFQYSAELAAVLANLFATEEQSRFNLTADYQVVESGGVYEVQRYGDDEFSLRGNDGANEWVINFFDFVPAHGALYTDSGSYFVLFDQDVATYAIYDFIEVAVIDAVLATDTFAVMKGLRLYQEIRITYAA